MQANPHGGVGASFGLIAKFVYANTRCGARFVSYGTCSLLINRADSRLVRLGHWKPELGRR